MRPQLEGYWATAAACAVDVGWATAGDAVASGCTTAAGGTGAGNADVLSLELNTVDFVPALGAGAGVGAASGSA